MECGWLHAQEIRWYELCRGHLPTSWFPTSAKIFIFPPNVSRRTVLFLYCQWPAIQTQPPGRRTQWPATQTAAGLGRTTQLPGTQT